MKREHYYIEVDEYGKWQYGKYRKVTADELDIILDDYAGKILKICSKGNKGAMIMWACFKSRLCGGCYHDMINSYSLLTDDSKSLVDREHELRHLWEEYETLWQIRYYGTVEQYYLDEAAKAKEHYEKYIGKVAGDSDE